MMRVYIFFLLALYSALVSGQSYFTPFIGCFSTLSNNASLREINAVYNDDETGHLYIGGNFSPLHSSTVYCAQGTNLHKIAKINIQTNAAVTSWNPNPNNQVIVGDVYAIYKMGNVILIGGSISNSTLGFNPPPPFRGLIAVNESNGAIVNTYSVSGGGAFVNSIHHKDGKLMVGGSFTSFNGTPCNNNVAIITTSNNVVYGTFSHQQVISSSIPTYTPGNITTIKQVKIIDNRLLAIAHDPSINGNSIVEFILGNGTIRRRLTLFASNPARELNYFCDQNDTLYIFASSNNGYYNQQSIKIVNNIDVGVPASILQWNLKNYGFGFKLSITGGNGAFPINFNTSWFPPTIDNTNYIGYPNQSYWGDFKPHAIVNGNKLQLYWDNETEPIYWGVFYKNGSKCYTVVDSTNTYDLRQLNYNRLKRWFVQGDKAIAIKRTKTNTNEHEVSVFCIKPDALMKPRAVGNQTIFCAGGTYTFVLPNPTVLKQFTWWYTGTGTSFQTNNNDTVVVSFSENATAGQLRVTGKTGCFVPVDADTSFMNITFLPKPVLNTKPSDTLNCKNNSQIILSATTNSNSSYFTWYGTNTPSTGVLSHSLFVNTPGTYSVRVTNTVSGCSNTKSVTVVNNFSTLPILNLIDSYTVPCTPPVITITAVGANTSADSLYWIVGNTTYSNPVVYTAVNQSNTITAVNKNRLSGCLNYKAFYIEKSLPPSYTITSALTTTSLSLPQFNPITCLNDSVLLNATSISGNWIRWKNSNGDTLQNPYWADVPGVYQLLVSDTSTNCHNQSFFGQVLSDINPPHLSITASSPSLNCSVISATLHGLSLTPGANINWYTPTFTTSTPLTTSSSGWFYASCFNPQNGCEKTDSIHIGLSNQLQLNLQYDSVVCHLGPLSATVAAAGGTPPFSYFWQNNASTIQSAVYLNQNGTSNYTVTVTDNNNCIGTHTLYFRAAAPLKDSIVTFKSCNPNQPSGQAIIYTKGGKAPYRYAIDGSSQFQSLNIFKNLNPGNHQVIISDTIGCIRTANFSIDNNSFSPKADFILNTTMMQGDTFVVVDISNPRPDSLHWKFPPTVQRISAPNPYQAIIVSQDTGHFVIKAKAFFNGCIDSLAKTVYFKKYDSLSTKKGVQLGIKTFSLYPNPNTGQFNVYVEFYKKQRFILKINTSGGAEIFSSLPYEEKQANIQVTMPLTTPGNYYVRILAEFDSKQKPFILSN